MSRGSIMEAVTYLSSSCSLRGKVVSARGSDKPVYAFLGVPYATPPVGPLRFKPPQPLPDWSGQRDATTFGPICPQDLAATQKSYGPYPTPQNESEDCLYLNVYTPTLDHTQRLPTMVWIHGGSFTEGFSDFYDGTALASMHNVIFVSINYRLNVFGFLSSGDDAAPGNYGLLDQVEALRWLQRHVTGFGGDPNNVTLFGESAGGISIALHCLSPLTKGLFRRAIMQSGVSTAPGLIWTPQNANKFLLARVKRLGCTSTNSKEIMDFLSAKSAGELRKHLGSFCSAVVDGYYLPDYPLNLYAKGAFHKEIDVILGFNNHEGAQFIFNLAKSFSVKNMPHARDILRTIVKTMFYRGNQNADKIMTALENHYLGNATDELSITQGLVDLYGDLLFVAPAIQMVNYHLDAGVPPYVYLYTHRPSYSPYPDWVQADHGHDVVLSLGEPFLERMPDVWNEEDRAVSRAIMTYWTNFAKTGNPNGSGQPIWTRYTRSAEDILEIQPRTKSIKNFRKNHVDFWNNTIKELAQVASKY